MQCSVFTCGFEWPLKSLDCCSHNIAVIVILKNEMKKHANYKSFEV